jgi:hypothetical protein
MIRLAAAALLTLALTSATQASSAQCLVSRPGVHVSFGVTIGVGEKFSESDQNEFNLMRLRPGGGEEMQFFHPDTFERVYM